MPKYIFLGCLNLLLLINFNVAFAQSQEYSDYKPVYRKWQDNYILDKIEYKKSTTIFYFRIHKHTCLCRKIKYKKFHSIQVYAKLIYTVVCVRKHETFKANKFLRK